MPVATPLRPNMFLGLSMIINVSQWNENEFTKVKCKNVLVSLKPRSMKLVNKKMLVWIGVNEIVNDVLMVKIYLMIWSWLKYIWVFELLKYIRKN